MIITYPGESTYDEADDTRIYAPHKYTTVNGYMYVNNTIYDRNGIEVFSDPNTTWGYTKNTYNIANNITVHTLSLESSAFSLRT